LTISRVSAALRQAGFAAACDSATGRGGGASASAALAAVHPKKTHQAPARQTMADAAMTTKPLLRTLRGHVRVTG
jgi:hypothetical protein